MMREHMGLYRGKRKDNGEWVEGFYVRNGDKHDIVNFMEPKNNKITFHGYGEMAWTTTIVVQHEVDPDTVGEATGVVIGGKMSFEGDAYRYFDDEIQVVEWNEDTHNIGLHTYGEREVKQGRKTIKEKFEGWNALWDYPLEEMEYLGNIHDNPELERR